MTHHPIDPATRHDMAPVVYVLFGAAVSVVCIVVAVVAAAL